MFLQLAQITIGNSYYSLLHLLLGSFCSITLHMPVSLVLSISGRSSRTPLVFSSIMISSNPIDISPVCPLPSELCALTAKDPFLFSVAVWSTLQLSWTIVLLASQLWQIARQMTTLEVSNLGRYGFMGGRGGASLSGQMGHRHGHGNGVSEADDASSAESTHGQAHRHAGVCAGCGCSFLMNLLGLDRFTTGKATTGLARASKATNPFDLGVVGNCKDFWTAGRELGVEYEKLYDVPAEGFREAKLRREREDDDDDHSISGSRKGFRKSLFMGLGIGRSGSSRAGYEPVNQV